MKYVRLFFARLSVLLTKWTAIGVLWLASVFLVTSSALLMDQFSDWARMIGGYTTPYAKQKKTAKAAKSQLAYQKRVVKGHSAKVRKIGSKMVVRNVADATTSLLPVVGGAASVGFAVTDVYAACELITAQKNFELLVYEGISDTYDTIIDPLIRSDKAQVQQDYSMLETTCITLTEKVEGLYTEAKVLMSELPDLPETGLPDGFPELPKVELPDVQIRVPDVTDELANMMCKVTRKC